MNIDINKVAAVYSGKQGCMCGCNGNWRHASTDPNLDSYDDVSDRSVKIVTGKLIRTIESGAYEALHIGRDCSGNTYVVLDLWERVRGVYFNCRDEEFENKYRHLDADDIKLRAKAAAMLSKISDDLAWDENARSNW